MKNGDILRNPWTDSHEDLVRLYKLRDTKVGNFARVEFTPKEQTDLDKPNKYVLRVDESVCPEWFTEAKQDKVADKLRAVVKSMIISGDADLLCGGVYILAGKAKVATLQACKVIVMMGNSNVGEMWESSKVEKDNREKK